MKLENFSVVRNGTFTAQHLSPEEAMMGYGFRPKEVWRDSLRFILPSLLSKVFRLKTPRGKVDEVYWRLHEYLLEVDADAEQLAKDVAGLDAGWKQMRRMLRQNRGMTKLMLDHGCRSKIIYPYILGGAQAVNLEVFNGRAFDLSGNFVDIPYSDRAIMYAVWEPIGVDIRERIMFEQNNLNSLARLAQNAGREMKVLTCGAGLCSFLRMYGFRVPKNCQIMAVDLDERNLDNLKLVFDDVRLTENGCVLPDYNVKYELASIEDVCYRSENRACFDLVNLQGVASYYRFGGKTKRLISDLLRVLRNDGVILLDLQVFEVSLLRCSLCMGWTSTLFPDWTVKSAVKRMQKICNQLNLEMEYQTCTRNKRPTTVLFRLRKRIEDSGS